MSPRAADLAHDRLQPRRMHQFLHVMRRRSYACAHASPCRSHARSSAVLAARRLRRVELGSGGEDPATAVPRDAALYVEATVRPEGELRENALDAAGKVLKTSDPQKRIDELVKEVFAGVRGSEARLREGHQAVAGREGRLLGGHRQAAEGEDLHGVAIVSATDTDKAQEAIDRAVKGSDKKFTERTYKDADYQVNGEGDGGRQCSRTTSCSAPRPRSSGRSPRPTATRSPTTTATRTRSASSRTTGSAHFYVDAKALIEQALKRGPGGAPAGRAVPQALPLDKLGPVAGVVLGRRRPARASTRFTSGAGGDFFKKFGALAGTGSTPAARRAPG